MTAADRRKYDIVVFGATGFTGGLVAEYLARNGDGAAVALAGRDLSRLAEVKQRMVDIEPACDGVDLIEADIRNASSLNVMALKARVVLTTVGPYVDRGESVVRACILGGADYVDITGEPEFVDGLLERCDATARERGVRVVNCCGFDSIPHDLGVLYTVAQLPSDQPIQVEGFVSFRGKVSGGTWHSAVQAMARYRDYQRERAARGRPRGASEASGANGASGESGAPERRVGSTSQKFRYDRELGKWVYPLPTIDPQVVKRSARALDAYGPDFRYGHYGTSKSLPRVAVGAVTIAGMFALAQFGPTRSRLLALRPQGEGPSAEERARSRFKVTFVGRAGDRRVVTRVSGGDPGYEETAVMVGESALCLARDRDRLPDRAGVITPAVAMGDLLIDRLQRAGLTFETLEP